MDSGARSISSCSRYPRYPPTSPPLSMIAQGKAQGVFTESDPADTRNLARLMVPRESSLLGTIGREGKGPGRPLALPAWGFFDPPTSDTRGRSGAIEAPRSPRSPQPRKERTLNWLRAQCPWTTWAAKSLAVCGSPETHRKRSWKAAGSLLGPWVPGPRKMSMDSILLSS